MKVARGTEFLVEIWQFQRTHTVFTGDRPAQIERKSYDIIEGLPPACFGG